MARYVLVPRTQPLPHYLPQGTLIRTPLQRAVLTTSVHAALLLDLHAERAIAGLTDTAYIVSPEVRQLLCQGVKSMGTALQPDLELMQAARADALLTSPFEGDGSARAQRLGIPQIACADYMESSPLGRAEWMRFYGRLFGQAERADSLFAAVEQHYLALAAQADSLTSKRTAPTV
ncbi:MAG: ABC transporter substrate-binding protein, partial [Rothia sp. (in: high G+C Gram-positive bacteria)]|uniref:ABC transporter substrate-binding protein n=1 Tax=Rothia sp. (in: high G+C Gram-positive bacteria) TaxID=1885016 RepID=UPI0026E0C95B